MPSKKSLHTVIAFEQDYHLMVISQVVGMFWFITILSRSGKTEHFANPEKPIRMLIILLCVIELLMYILLGVKNILKLASYK